MRWTFVLETYVVSLWKGLWGKATFGFYLVFLCVFAVAAGGGSARGVDV